MFADISLKRTAEPGGGGAAPFPLAGFFRRPSLAAVVRDLAMQALFHLGIAPRQAAVDTAMQAPATAKLQLPILNVGLPQSGSQEVLDFFGCGGMKTSHYHCEADCTGARAGFDSCKMQAMRNYCGSCVTDNIKAGTPPLTGCGDYDVWAKLDGPWLALDAPAGDCILPQVRSLDAIHEAYPHATLVLPIIPAAKWVQMVTNGNATRGTLRQNLRKCNLADTDHPCPADCVDDDVKFAAFYDAHSQSIRKWAEKYPTHQLIEINVEGQDAGSKLGAATGIKGTCWPEKKIWTPVADEKPAFDDGSYRPPQQQQQQPVISTVVTQQEPAAQQESTPQSAAEKATNDAIAEDQLKTEAAASALADAAAKAAVDQQKAQKAALESAAEAAAAKAKEDQKSRTDASDQVAKDQAQRAAQAAEVTGAPVPEPPVTPEIPSVPVDPGYDHTGCKDEKCAKRARHAAEKQAQKEAEAAEVQRVAEEEKQQAKDAVAAAKEAKRSEKERIKNENEAMKQAEIDNSKAKSPDGAITPKDRDPNIVCVSFKEGVNEDWCYAACTNGVCPPDAAKDCMCATGGEGGQSSGNPEGPGGAAQATSAQATPAQATPAVVPNPNPNPALACASIGAGVSDSWCTNSCKPPDGGTVNCPEAMCKCDDTAENVLRARAVGAAATMAAFSRF